MKLIGSKTSPFVRKVRLLLQDQNYDFEELKALSPEGTEKLKQYGPVLRIPILIVGGQTLFDSSLICEYLLEKKNITISIEEKMTLKLIDELCDAGISLFQQILWNIDPEWKNEQSKRNLLRANSILEVLNEKQKNDSLTSFQKDWLFCVLDWFQFRDVIKWQDNYKNLFNFYQENISNPNYLSTKPEA